MGWHFWIIIIFGIITALVLETIMYIDGWKQLTNLLNEEGSVASEITQAREKSASYRGLAAKAKNPEAQEILNEPSPVYDYFKMFYEKNEEMAKGRIKSVGISSDDPYELRNLTGSGYIDVNPEEFSQRISGDLVELGLSDKAIAGIIGSLDYESLGFTRYKEIEGPGISAAQYTNMGGVNKSKRQKFISENDYDGLIKIGARKDAFLAYSSANKKDPRTYEAFRDFMFYELQYSPESTVLKRLEDVGSAEEAAVIFTNKFLRPNKEKANLGKRKSLAKKFYNTYFN